jgi:chaperone required for assembly of F1-ATPase
MGETNNPMAAAQRLMRPVLPKRFYKTVSVAPHEGGFTVRLDERTVRTPGKKMLVVRDRRIVEALAAEWEAQTTVVDPKTMPLTKLVNVALDRVASEALAVQAEIVKYAGSDLICYRAAGPAGLAEAQDKQWAPLVVWARDTLGVQLRLAVGVVHVAQDRAVGDAVARAVAGLDVLRLAALHVAMTLTGSAVIALALSRGRLTTDQAWAAAHVDEDWQISQWGADDIALKAHAARRRVEDGVGNLGDAVEPAEPRPRQFAAEAADDDTAVYAALAASLVVPARFDRLDVERVPVLDRDQVKPASARQVGVATGAASSAERQDHRVGVGLSDLRYDPRPAAGRRVLGLRHANRGQPGRRRDRYPSRNGHCPLSPGRRPTIASRGTPGGMPSAGNGAAFPPPTPMLCRIGEGGGT